MVFIHKIFFEKIYAYKTKFQTFLLPYKSALLRREHIYVNKECNFLNSQLSLQTILLLIPFNELPYASLRLHYSENHQESVDVCGVCGYVVENSKALELHWKTSHLSWTPVLNCDFCDREFYAQGSLDNHTYKVHKIQTSFSCELCQFHCTRRSELETHIQVIFGIFEQKTQLFQDIVP